jgi:TPR repeat protein
VREKEGLMGEKAERVGWGDVSMREEGVWVSEEEKNALQWYRCVRSIDHRFHF